MNQLPNNMYTSVSPESSDSTFMAHDTYMAWKRHINIHSPEKLQS
jgi:hypothetical protein